MSDIARATRSGVADGPRTDCTCAAIPSTLMSLPCSLNLDSYPACPACVISAFDSFSASSIVVFWSDRMFVFVST